MASTVEKSIEVGVPVRNVYNQWTQFEEFPHFMGGVKEVKQISDKRMTWRAEVGGKEKIWEAEIVEQTPDTRISWRSTSGADNQGVVSFLPVDGGRTKVTVAMTYDPEGLVENIGDLVGVVGSRVEGDLERFKEFIEARGRETGGWRGEIHGAKVEKTGQSGLSSATGR